MCLHQLIVCSDNRSRQLAAVIAPMGPVFSRRLNENGYWTYSLFQNGAWQVAANEDLPTRFDLLFVHGGAGDPNGVPDDRDIPPASFAFSGGGAPDVKIGDTKLIPIRGSFRMDGCPVLPAHLPGLEAFARDPRAPLPQFCQDRRAAAASCALLILCQYYLCVAASAGEISPGDDTLAEIGWTRLPESSRPDGLAARWVEVQTRAWWNRALGIEGEGVGLPLALCSEVAQELECEAAIGRVAQSEDAKALKSDPDICWLADLLVGERIEVDSVRRAYRGLHDRLSALCAG